MVQTSTILIRNLGDGKNGFLDPEKKYNKEDDPGAEKVKDDAEVDIAELVVEGKVGENTRRQHCQ